MKNQKMVNICKAAHAFKKALGCSMSKAMKLAWNVARFAETQGWIESYKSIIKAERKQLLRASFK